MSYLVPIDGVQHGNTLITFGPKPNRTTHSFYVSQDNYLSPITPFRPFSSISVYVMLADFYEFEGLLIALRLKGLLDTGEYIVVGVDPKQYDSSDPQKYIEGKFWIGTGMGLRIHGNRCL